MPHPVPVRRTALFTALALACGPVAPITTYTSPAVTRQNQAAGNPIAPCAELQATVARMRAGLPAKDETIRKTQEQLDAARRGVKESTQELQMLALKEATAAAVHQLDFVRAAKSGIAASAAGNQTRMFLNSSVDKVRDAAEKLQGLITSGASGVNIGAALRENQLTWEKFATEMNDSGIADEFGKLGFKAIFGPVLGEVAFDLGVAVRDGVAAGWGLYNNISDADAAQKTLDTLVQEKNRILGRISEIDSILTSQDFNCAQPAPRPQDRIMTQPPADPPPYTPVPPAKPAAAQPAAAPQKHGSGGQAVVGLLLGGAVAAGAYGYVKNKYGTDNTTCTAPTADIIAICGAGSGSTACKTALANQVAYCQCRGYATFDAGAGTCR